MKKLVFTIVLTIFSFSVFSQYNPELDRKNGFKDFKFGDLKSHYISNGSISDNGSKNSDGGIVYYYKEDNPNSLFNHKWDYLSLTFYGDKLGKIYISWDNITKEERRDIRWKLEKIFGDAYYDDIQDASLNNALNRIEKTKSHLYKCYTWEGDKIFMELTVKRYKFSFPLNADFYDDGMILEIKNKETLKEFLKSGF